MTDAELKAARERCDAASPAPWSSEVACLNVRSENVWAPDGDVVAECYGNPAHGDGVDSHDNARFIAAARTDLPRAIDEVERLRAMLRRVEWAGRAELCPRCRSHRAYGHNLGCELAAMLEGR